MCSAFREESNVGGFVKFGLKMAEFKIDEVYLFIIYSSVATFYKCLLASLNFY